MRRPFRISALGIVQTVIAIAIILVVGWSVIETIAAGKLQPETWRNLLLFGVSAGSLYALIALGYTLVYGVLLMINFAHGDVYMFGAFSGFFVGDYLLTSGFLPANEAVSILIMIAAGAVTSMALAILLERVAYRPLRRAPRLVPLITAIGASLFIANSARGFYGDGVKAYPRFEILDGSFEILGVPILKGHTMVIIAAIILMAVLYWFVNRTKTGRAMRAVSEDKDTAALMGIDVDRIISTTFAVGGLLAGAAGVLYAVVYNQVVWNMGFFPGIKAFTAAVLGGIGNIVGAMLGGVMLGVLEQLMPVLLLQGHGVPSPHQLKDVIAFTVLVLVLIFRPYGLLGRPEGK